MIGWYLFKLALLLPLMAGLIWGSLKLSRHLQARVGGTTTRERSIRIVETMMLSPGQRLAVIEFRGREILVSATRSGLTRLAENEVPR